MARHRIAMLLTMSLRFDYHTPTGSVTTLEEWFDPARLRDDYTPSGYKGFKVTRRAVPGHQFGLTLDAEDKSALIAYLKTL
jgi:hypothetical protein